MEAGPTKRNLDARGQRMVSSGSAPAEEDRRRARARISGVKRLGWRPQREWFAPDRTAELELRDDSLGRPRRRGEKFGPGVEQTKRERER
jgi:hypothetical protein